MQIRNLKPEDYSEVIAVVDDWWGGRSMTAMLPKLFFVYFCETSFVIEDADKLIAFLVGFVSQSHPGEAHIHFIGIHPDHRKSGFGRHLYEQFFRTVRARGCVIVRAVTSPENFGSIAFHQRMGFQVEEVSGAYMDVPCALDYDGKGEHRVLFVKNL